MTWWKEYSEFLKSAKWKITRDRAFAKYGRLCSCCGTRSTLEVHHLDYQNYKNGNLNSLRVLCNYCHKEVTAVTRKGRLKGVYAVAFHRKNCVKRNRIKR